jgi:DNA repair exonuclease SbcCD nuclease subunit
LIYRQGFCYYVVMSKLFNKAAVFTDVHWGLKSNSLQHNIDCTNFVNWFIETAKKKGCDVCFFLGDWNHHRASINIQTLQFGLRALERLNESFDQVFFIAGNHDLYYRDKRDIHSVEWAKHLSNVKIVDDFFQSGEVIIAPWLVEDDWKKLKNMSGKYLFGHFELPHFYMNSLVEMPDHGELQAEHMSSFEHVFSGHFHKRQVRKNITYIGNAFPHNYSDVNDDDRGMMILDWNGESEFLSWPDQPRFRVYKLSEILSDESLLQRDMHVRINLDIDVSYEESNFIREQLLPKYHLREMHLIPTKLDIEQDNTDYTNMKFESVDSIIQEQIQQLSDGQFDKKLLLDIYQNL